MTYDGARKSFPANTRERDIRKQTGSHHTKKYNLLKEQKKKSLKLIEIWNSML